LPELEIAETKRRQKKKKESKLSKLAHAKKQALQTQAQELIQSNRVF